MGARNQTPVLPTAEASFRPDANFFTRKGRNRSPMLISYCLNSKRNSFAFIEGAPSSFLRFFLRGLKLPSFLCGFQIPGMNLTSKDMSPRVFQMFAHIYCSGLASVWGNATDFYSIYL